MPTNNFIPSTDAGLRTFVTSPTASQFASRCTAGSDARDTGSRQYVCRPCSCKGPDNNCLVVRLQSPASDGRHSDCRRGLGPVGHGVGASPCTRTCHGTEQLSTPLRRRSADLCHQLLPPHDLQAELFGLVDEVAEYVIAVNTYTSELQAAEDPETRGRKAIWRKNETKKEVIRLTRKYAKQIGGLVDVSDELKLDLGLNVSTGERRSIPRPTMAPLVKVRLGEGRRIIVELLQSKTRRAKPADVAGATIFTHLGPVAPDSITEWQLRRAGHADAGRDPVPAEHHGRHGLGERVLDERQGRKRAEQHADQREPAGRRCPAAGDGRSEADADAHGGVSAPSGTGTRRRRGASCVRRRLRAHGSIVIHGAVAQRDKRTGVAGGDPGCGR